MKKTLLALTVATLGFATAADAATTATATATWQAIARKDVQALLVVTPLYSLNFQYAEGIKGFNTMDGLFDVTIKGIPGSPATTGFTLKAKKLSGVLNHLANQSTVDVGMRWNGTPLTTTAYTTLIDASSLANPAISGGSLSPLIAGATDGTKRTSAQGNFNFFIEKGTTSTGTPAATFDLLPDGLWQGQVTVEFVANWS